MAEIDTLLQKLSQMNAECATLRADENVEVVVAGGTKHGAYLKESLLRTFLLEVIPDDRKPELHARIPINFNYASAHGEYDFVITGYPGRLQAVISPVRLKSQNSRAVPLEVALENAALVDTSAQKLKWLQLLLLLSAIVLLSIGASFFLR